MATMAEIMDGYHFWKQIDEINPYGTAAELSKQMGINYYAMKQWRADSRIPKAETLLLLSQVLNRSIEFLLTGINQGCYSERVERIADACQRKASDEDLFVIEKILGLETSSVVIRNDDAIETKKASGSIA